MKKLSISLIILSMMVVLIGPSAAMAGAYETSFVTSITYQNVGDAATTLLQILFYENKDDTTPVAITRPNLAAGAGTSVYVGSLTGLPTSLQGTAVMTSDKPLVATLVQVGQSSTIKARPLSNGFSEGAQNSLIATVLKHSTINSIFAVQNAGGSAATVDIDLYAVGAASPTYSINNVVIQSGAGYYVDLGTIGALGSTFSGSVVVAGQSATDKIVSSAMELDAGTGTGAKAFEGLGQGATSFFMPSALCVTGGPTTYYAVQNTSTTNSAYVTVTYSPGGYTQNATILPGNKASFNTCAAGMTSPWGGSAVVTSGAPTNAPVIAMGKVTGGGLATAYVGVQSGAQKTALPYVRYANNTQYFTQSLQRTFIAIQNVGAAIPAGSNILVKYINPDGSVAGTQTYSTGLAQYAKFSSNATLTDVPLTEFGYTGGVSGGGVIVEGPAGSQLAVIARVQTYISPTNQPGEDYNGIPIP